MDVVPEAVDWVTTQLSTIGYAGELTITNYDRLAVPSPVVSDGNQPDWRFTICLYIPYQSGSNAQADAIATHLNALQRTGLASALQMQMVEEKPVISPMQQLDQHRIGQRFVLLFSDAASTASDLNTGFCPNRLYLKLKPSLAFGSGLHPATMLSLLLLERYVTPAMSTLDLGCGSGILSVAMAKLGAAVLALDNDRTAVVATQDAIAWNGVEQNVRVKLGSLGEGSQLGHWLGGTLPQTIPTIQPAAAFDLIVANILARVHIALSADFRQALRSSQFHDGILIASGFTTDYEADVHKSFCEAGFQFLDCERCHEWVALAYRLSLN